MTTLRGYNPRAFLHFSGEVIICISFGYDIHQCVPPFITHEDRLNISSLFRWSKKQTIKYIGIQI